MRTTKEPLLFACMLGRPHSWLVGRPKPKAFLSRSICLRRRDASAPLEGQTGSCQGSDVLRVSSSLASALDHTTPSVDAAKEVIGEAKALYI